MIDYRPIPTADADALHVRLATGSPLTADELESLEYYDSVAAYEGCHDTLSDLD